MSRFEAASSFAHDIRISAKKEQSAVALSASGKRLIVASDEGHVCVLRLPEYVPVCQLHLHAKGINDVDITADGMLVGTAGRDFAAYVWLSDSGKVVQKIEPVMPRTLKTHIRAIRFSAVDENIIFTGESNPRKGAWIACWRRAEGVSSKAWKPVGHIKAMSDALTAFTISRDGRLAAVSSAEGHVALFRWNRHKFSKAWSTETRLDWFSRPLAPHVLPVTAMKFSSSSKTLFTASADYTVAAWPTRRPRNLKRLLRRSGFVGIFLVPLLAILLAEDRHLPEFLYERRQALQPHLEPHLSAFQDSVRPTLRETGERLQPYLTELSAAVGPHLKITQDKLLPILTEGVNLGRSWERSLRDVAVQLRDLANRSKMILLDFSWRTLVYVEPHYVEVAQKVRNVSSVAMSKASALIRTALDRESVDMDSKSNASKEATVELDPPSPEIDAGAFDADVELKELARSEQRDVPLDEEEVKSNCQESIDDWVPTASSDSITEDSAQPKVSSQPINLSGTEDVDVQEAADPEITSDFTRTMVPTKSDVHADENTGTMEDAVEFDRRSMESSSSVVPSVNTKGLRDDAGLREPEKSQMEKEQETSLDEKREKSCPNEFNVGILVDEQAMVGSEESVELGLLDASTKAEGEGAEQDFSPPHVDGSTDEDDNTTFRDEVSVSSLEFGDVSPAIGKGSLGLEDSAQETPESSPSIPIELELDLNSEVMTDHRAESEMKKGSRSLDISPPILHAAGRDDNDKNSVAGKAIRSKASTASGIENLQPSVKPSSKSSYESGGVEFNDTIAAPVLKAEKRPLPLESAHDLGQTMPTSKDEAPSAEYREEVDLPDGHDIEYDIEYDADKGQVGVDHESKVTDGEGEGEEQEGEDGQENAAEEDSLYVADSLHVEDDDGSLAVMVTEASAGGESRVGSEKIQKDNVRDAGILSMAKDKSTRSSALADSVTRVDEGKGVCERTSFRL